MVNITPGRYLPQSFWTDPEAACVRLTKSQVREMLLAGYFVIARGHIWDIQRKHVGLGVYEVTLKRRHGADPR